MKKKVSAIAMSFLIMAIAMSIMAGCGNEKIESEIKPTEGLKYELISQNEQSSYCVTGIDSYDGFGVLKIEQLVIPEEYNGLPVTKIREYAFEERTGIKSLILPSTIDEIGEYAFSYCTGLSSITVKSGNKRYHSVNNCLIDTAEKKLVLGCKNSIIPTDGTVTSIGEYAFHGCYALKSIYIPKNITIISENSFSACKGMVTLDVDAENPNYSSHDGIMYDKSKTQIVYVPESISGEISLPESLTKIRDHAFHDRVKLTGITIPDNVTYIGNYAFTDCRALKNVVIGKNVTNIDFSGCRSLESITFGGTCAQWKSLDKEEIWLYDTGNFTVECADGTLPKSES